MGGRREGNGGVNWGPQGHFVNNFEGGIFCLMIFERIVVYKFSHPTHIINFQ